MIRTVVFFAVYSLAIGGTAGACLTARHYVEGELTLKTEDCFEPDRGPTVCRELDEPEEENSAKDLAGFWAGASAGFVLIPGAYLVSVGTLRLLRRTNPGETKGLSEGFRFVGVFATVIASVWVGIVVLATR